MKYRKTAIGGDIFQIIEHQRKVSSSIKGINRLNKSIDWEFFRDLLEELLGYKNRDPKKGGRPPFDPVMMFKILILQRLYNLSDEATEDQISDRYSFMEFLGLRPGGPIPDKNTIWDFRELLEANGKNGTALLFKKFEIMLEQEGIIAKEGSLVDASFVDAPKQRNTRDDNKEIKACERPEHFDCNQSVGCQKDTDARWVSKNKEVHYGYKNHVKVDAKRKLIISYATTDASVHDSQVFKDIVNDTDNALYADSAYQSEESENYLLKECDCCNFIQFKAARNRPLTQEERKVNHTMSRVRVRVEHVFGRMSQMGMDFCRKIGKVRANQHNGLCNLVYNMDSYAYLANR